MHGWAWVLSRETVAVVGIWGDRMASVERLSEIDAGWALEFVKITLAVFRRRPTSRFSWRDVLVHVGPYGAALALLIVLRQSSLTQKVNLLAYDVAVQIRPKPSGTRTPVRIIGIDDSDLKHYGPFVPDELLATAIERLDRIGVRAIGLDIFAGQGVGAGHERLRKLAATNSRLVSIFYKPDDKTAIPGTPSDRQAYADIYTDRDDGVLRRDLLHVVGPKIGSADVALPMRLLEIATGSRSLRMRLVSQEARMAFLEVGGGGYNPDADVSSPIHLQRMLAFHQPGSFPTMNLRTLLEGQLTTQERDLLRDRIVLIGYTALSKKDTFATPFSLGDDGERRVKMPGVEIHAHRLASLLALAAGHPLGIQAAPRSLNAVLLLMACAAGVLLGEGIPSLRRSLMLGVVVALLALGVAVAVLLWGLWLDAALPIAAFALLSIAAWTRRGADQQRKRQEVQNLLGQSTLRTHQLEKHNQVVREMFGRFVSQDVAQELLTEPTPLRRGCELREVTILMADLRGFSLISQRYEPADMVRLLNIYLESMTHTINRYGGTVGEVLGDALLVLFGAPTARDDHREGAITCAVAMQQAMEGVNAKNITEGLPVVEMGIGICTGEVMVGTIGSSVRAKYGVVGTAVNMASRIEGLTVGGEILAAESTVNGIMAQLCIVSEHRFEPKGSESSLRVFSVAGIGDDRIPALPETQDRIVELKAPIGISVCLMNGKQRDERIYSAQITHVGARSAQLMLQEECLEPFTNLVLRLPGVETDIHAKVRVMGDHSAFIHYTYVPEPAKAFLSSVACHENV